MIVAVALGLALAIQAFVIKPYKIPSESMVPTLEVGERVLVNRVGKRLGDPQRRRHRRLPPARGRRERGAARSAARAVRSGAPCDKPTPRRPRSTSSSASSAARATRSRCARGT